MEITLSKKQSIREQIAGRIVNFSKPIYFLLRYKRKAWKVTQAELATYPQNSLGKDLSEFLTANNLQLMPKAEFHDVYHVLLGFGTTMREETCIQFVSMGNGNYSLPHLAANFTSLLFYPEHWGDFKDAFMRGRKAARFYDLDFENLLKMPTSRLRECLLYKRERYILS